MSSTRAPKRRKLEDPGAQDPPTPSATQKLSNGGAHSNSQTKRTEYSHSEVGSNGRSAEEMWKLAKQKSREHNNEVRRKARAERSEMDLYDDIEGGNVGQKPYSMSDRPQKKRRISNPANGDLEKTKGQQRRDPASGSAVSHGDTKSSPVKKVLDPLKNQKAPESPSPRKPGSSLGFFKKFTKAEVAKQSTGPDPSAEKQSPRTAVKNNAAQRTAVNQRWTYGKPKKTFEDEMREIAENARNGIGDAESEDELASAGEAHRSSTKRHSLRNPVAEPVVEEKAIASPTPKRTKSLDRRKPKILMEDPAEDETIDILEVPESENEAEAIVPANVKKSTDEENSAVTPKKAAARLPQKRKSETGSPFDSAHLRCIQQIALEKITGKRSTPLTELDSEYAKVASIIDQTVTAGESNSMLLIGARGCGKTALINQVLHEQAKKHSDDFHVVRLNGFVHTDDKIALRDIWRQLGREMELDEDESSAKNYADTMSKLLALLSHPAEMGTGSADQITKSVIFILDEFELFATHPRQTLLYNLFDIAQSRKAPIAVLGLTTRIDVAESLEKRVKSRFSHRYVHLALPKSFESFKRICSAALMLTSEELADEERSVLKATVNANGSEPLNLWNEVTTEALATEPWAALLRRIYYTTKSVPDILAPLILAIATMPTAQGTTTTSLLSHFSSPSATLQPPDSKLSLLPSLSTLQLALLICSARLTNIFNTEIISFALAYEEYRTLASKAKLQASASGALAQGAGTRVWGKEIAKAAWRELVEVGLVVEDGRAGGTGRVDVGLEEIGMCGVELGMWRRWCREI